MCRVPGLWIFRRLCSTGEWPGWSSPCSMVGYERRCEHADIHTSCNVVVETGKEEDKNRGLPPFSCPNGSGGRTTGFTRAATSSSQMPQATLLPAVAVLGGERFLSKTASKDSSGSFFLSCRLPLGWPKMRVTEVDMHTDQPRFLIIGSPCKLRS